MKKFMKIISFFLLIFSLFLVPQETRAQVVHCVSGSLGCAVDFSQSNPNTCASCPDPTNINSCCASQPIQSCADVICAGPTLTPTPTSPLPSPTPTSGACSPGDPANCSSGPGCYSCEWDVATGTCFGSIGSTYQCNSGFHVDDSVCSNYTNMSDCLGCGVNLLCEEVVDAVGYKCDSTTFGCFPCTAGDTSFGCNPPEYSDIDACEAACSGDVPTRFNCVDGECTEAQDGSYSTFEACTLECGPSVALCSGEESIDSAIGCIPVGNTTQFLTTILPWFAGIGAGAAFLMMIYAGIIIATSAGDPQKLNTGKQLLTAAVAGLLLVMFSAYLLRLIGVDILQIPGFGTGT